MNLPLVSILCPTYQHSAYIESALWGFLSQVSSYPYEIIVRDDASQDSTGQVIEEYAKRYPSLVIPILETENTWPNIRPTEVMVPRASGEYVAFCEGDDYWFDPGKIQDQMDAICGDQQIQLVETYCLNIEDGVITGKSQGGTRSYLLRRTCLEEFLSDDQAMRVPHTDIALKLFLRSRGKLVTIPRPTAVWRYHAGGSFGPRGRTEPRSIAADDWLSIFWGGWIAVDSGAPKARELVARELVRRSLTPLDIPITRWLDRVIIPVFFDLLVAKLRSLRHQIFTYRRD